ncbi:B-cell receptor CD22 [Carassius gibelio]|uniref:B-cell receptor CD22 n=1 Tax=Carassius gibelio TaxID=101364 RepID=UPI002279A48F|nr:B-cell receptor CD22 [Carassius gibelio]
MFYISTLLPMLLSAAVASLSVLYHPKSICVLERSSVDFSCTFDYPLYSTLKTTRWFKPLSNQKQDGTQFGISVYHSNTAEIHQLYKNRTAYANQDRNCSLQIHNVSKSDNGMYFFRLEYDHGKYTGPWGINLSVAVLPFRVTVKTQKKNGHIHEGDSVTLTCGTENCTPKKEPFAWFKNQRLIPEATDNVFHIASVSHHDFGNYSCGLKTSSSTSTDEILLDVKYIPKNVEIAVFPSGKKREGNSLTLICMNNANPSVTNYSWFLIKEAKVSHIGLDREFYIKSASQKDNGQYFCIAKNDMGSQNSSVIALNVEVSVHQNVLLTATAVFLFLMAVVIFGLIIWRIQFTSKKHPTEQTPAATVTEEIYENLRKSQESEGKYYTSVVYADLSLPPASDRPRCNSQAADTVIIYSLLSYNK